MKEITFNLKKDNVFGVLLYVYLLAFIISPYWLFFNSIYLKLLFLTSILGLGIIWSNIASSAIIIKIKPQNLLYYIVIAFIAIVINYNPINSDLTFGGDEIHHIFKPLIIVKMLRPLHILTVLAAVCLIPFIILKSNKIIIIISAIIISILVALFFIFIIDNSIISDLQTNVLRYPFFLSIVGSIVPLFAKIGGGEYHSFLYRIIPLLSTIFIGFFSFNYLNKHNYFNRLLITLSIISIPLIYFYSSILELEMPAILLIFIVILNIRDLLNANYDNIIKLQSWYALILIGFIKETTIVFLFTFLLVRFIIQLYNKKRLFFKKNNLFNEIKIAFIVSLPLVIYLLFRESNIRPFIPDIIGVFNPDIYFNLIKYLSIQNGVILIFSIIGITLLIKKKKYDDILLIFSFISIYILFFALERKGMYLGYSRFNLFFVPIIIYSTLFFIKYLSFPKYTIPIVGILIIVSNIFLSPINIDGSRKSGWEHTAADLNYPYKQAFKYIKKNNCENILFIQYRAFVYDRFNEFYNSKYDIKNDIQTINYEKNTLKNALHSVKSKKYDVIIAQLLPGETFNSKKHNIKEYKVIIYKNLENQLIIYNKNLD